MPSPIPNPSRTSSADPSPAENNNSNYAIRPAKLSDAEAISSLLLYLWPLTYSPFVSRDLIAQYASPRHSAEKIGESLSDEKDGWVVAVPLPSASGAADAQQVLGIAKICPLPLPSVPGTDPSSSSLVTELQRPSYLALFYVHPSAHGTGLARALISAAEELAKFRSHDGMWLAVLGVNARAIRFYEKSGYVKFGEQEEQGWFPRTDHYMVTRF